MIRLQPVTQREASAFIRREHRHHLPAQGFKFAIGAAVDGRIVGVVTVGRPIARSLDDGWTAEATRCCTDGTPHVASKLYAAAWRAARAMGYRRLVTYTLAHELGTSLKAAGWRELYVTAGGVWDRPSRARVDGPNTGPKTLWDVGAA